MLSSKKIRSTDLLNRLEATKQKGKISLPMVVTIDDHISFDEFRYTFRKMILAKLPSRIDFTHFDKIPNLIENQDAKNTIHEEFEFFFQLPFFCRFHFNFSGITDENKKIVMGMIKKLNQTPNSFSSLMQPNMKVISYDKDPATSSINQHRLYAYHTEEDDVVLNDFEDVYDGDPFKIKPHQ